MIGCRQTLRTHRSDPMIVELILHFEYRHFLLGFYGKRENEVVSNHTGLSSTLSFSTPVRLELKTHLSSSLRNKLIWYVSLASSINLTCLNLVFIKTYSYTFHKSGLVF